MSFLKKKKWMTLMQQSIKSNITAAKENVATFHSFKETN